MGAPLEEVKKSAPEANLTFVTRIEKNENGADFAVAAVNRNGIETIRTKTLVLATGCRERTARQVSIHGTRPAGVYTAGAAQHFTNLLGQLPTRRCVIPGTGEIIEYDGLILSVGLIPENELAQSLGVTLDPRTKGPVCNGQLMTSVDGIFSCGNALHVEGQPGSFRVSGNACKRGEAFAISEQTAPMRTLCTTVRTGFAAVPVLPVRLSGEIPKEKIFDAMAAINAITLARHIAIGGVIEPDLAGLGVDLIAASGLLRPADG